MKVIEKTANTLLTSEIKLQINQRLYDSHRISKELYEAAKAKIVADVEYKKIKESCQKESEVYKDVPAPSYL